VMSQSSQSSRRRRSREAYLLVVAFIMLVDLDSMI